MKVSQLMIRPVQWCSPSDGLDVPSRQMWENDFGSVPVCLPDADGEPHVVAMLTDRDVAMAAYTQGRALHDIPVQTAMSRALVTCRPTDSIGQVLKLMRARQIHRIPVVEAEERLVGILSLSDVARATADGTEKDVATDTVATALREICAPRQSHAVTVAA